MLQHSSPRSSQWQTKRSTESPLPRKRLPSPSWGGAGGGGRNHPCHLSPNPSPKRRGGSSVGCVYPAPALSRGLSHPPEVPGQARDAGDTARKTSSLKGPIPPP